MNQRKAGILLGYLVMAVHALTAFLYVPILLHYIGQNGYGLYQLIGSLISYLTILYSGISAALLRYYVRYRALQDEERMARLLGSSFKVYGGLSMIIMAGGGLCYWFLDKIFAGSLTFQEINDARILLLIFLCNTGIAIGTSTFRSVVMANEKFVFLKGMELLQIILQPILVILVLMEIPSVISVAVVQTICNVFLAGMSIYYCFCKLAVRISWGRLDRKTFKEFIQLSFSLLIVALIDQLFFQASKIILGMVDGTAAVAVFSVAILIFLNYRMLAGTITEMFLPHVTALVSSRAAEADISHVYIRVGRVQYLLLFLLFSGFFIFGKEFIHLWAGEAFDGAYWMTMIVLGPMTIGLIQGTGGSVLQAMNKFRFYTAAYSCAGIGNVLLTWFWADLYGGMGCAWAMAVSLGSEAIIMTWYYGTAAHLDIWNFWKQIGHITIWGILCLCIGMGINSLFHTGSIIVFGAKICLYILLYVGIMGVFATNKDEKGMVVRMLDVKI